MLVARWTLYDPADKALMTRVSIIVESSGGGGYESLISAQNRALQKLSKEIADAVKAAQ